MSKIFTLDSFREEAEKKFQPLRVELPSGLVVKFRSLLTLNSDTRKAVLAQIESLQSSDPEPVEGEDGAEVKAPAKTFDDLDEMVAAATLVLESVADHPKELVAALDGDLTLLLEVIKQWMASTQMGEAESSPA